MNSDYYINKFSIIEKIKNNEIKQKIFYDIKVKKLILNSLFLKNYSFSFINNDLQNALLPKPIPNKMYSSSLSITKHPEYNDKYVINIRLVNYCLTINGNSTLDGRIHTGFTLNLFLITDNNFNSIYDKIINPVIENKPYIGIEDIRLFTFKNNIYYIGSCYDNLTKTVKIVSDVLNLKDVSYNENFICPSFKTEFNWEKNWVFFETNSNLYIIYKWNPIYICEIDYNSKKLNLVKEIKTLDLFKDFRGSTNGVKYNNKIWFIIHSQYLLYNKKYYTHRFIVLNEDLTIYGYSDNFKFENYIVEFCIGMEITNDNKFIITYSTLDCTSKLAVFSSEYINSLIKNI